MIREAPALFEVVLGVELTDLTLSQAGELVYLLDNNIKKFKYSHQAIERLPSDSNEATLDPIINGSLPACFEQMFTVIECRRTFQPVGKRAKPCNIC